MTARESRKKAACVLSLIPASAGPVSGIMPREKRHLAAPAVSDRTPFYGADLL